MMINRRRFCGGKSLPYDAEVEYLGSDGYAYIDTGVLNTYNIRVELDFSLLKGNIGTWIYGARVGFGKSSNTLFLDKISGFEWRYGTDTISSEKGGAGHFVASNLDNANIMTISGDLSLSLTAQTSSFITSLPIYIFALNNNSQASSATGNICSIKYFKMYNGATLVRDYVPVRVGQVGYMYDKVTKQLFGNARTGSFILGPDV